MALGVLLWLWHCVRTVEEKSHDFFEHFFADIDGAVNAIRRLRPIYFARGYLPRQSFSAVAKLDFEQVATEDHGHPMKGITMPGRRLPRDQPLPPHQVIPAMMQYFLIGRDFHG